MYALFDNFNVEYKEEINKWLIKLYNKSSENLSLLKPIRGYNAYYSEDNNKIRRISKKPNFRSSISNYFVIAKNVKMKEWSEPIVVNEYELNHENRDAVERSKNDVIRREFFKENDFYKYDKKIMNKKFADNDLSPLPLFNYEYSPEYGLRKINI